MNSTNSTTHKLFRNFIFCKDIDLEKRVVEIIEANPLFFSEKQPFNQKQL